MQRALAAYGKVAVKRAADNAPNIVENQLLHTLHDEISEKTSRFSDKQLENMLMDYQTTMRRRDELKQGILKYSGALKAFKNIRTCQSISDLCA